AEVVVWVSCEELRIYNGFSPNNDDINDTFRIDGLDRFPNNHLQVFSRWGNKVFEAINYKNDWGGKWNGADLADGTYFYLFDDGNGKVYSGYVQIQR
ncbi:MAG TPA: gliding motility-associated C-terminal domain-containing protein, partial [Saprospiraceae bacterium]|nr:gliding motility-associated C-terminal domain-containing protein [Saprospiraceae bacterium]